MGARFRFVLFVPSDSVPSLPQINFHFIDLPRQVVTYLGTKAIRFVAFLRLATTTREESVPVEYLSHTGCLHERGKAIRLVAVLRLAITISDESTPVDYTSQTNCLRLSGRALHWIRFIK